jgi:hypothetical protein
MNLFSLEGPPLAAIIAHEVRVPLIFGEPVTTFVPSVLILTVVGLEPVLIQNPKLLHGLPLPILRSWRETDSGDYS